MKDGGYMINEGSLCFDIPFFIKSKQENILFKYFEEVQSIYKKLQSEKDPDKRLEFKKQRKSKESEFIERFTSRFKNVKSIFKPHACSSDYKGRFLCKCFSLASKFHDDNSQSRETMQLWLDSFPITYKCVETGDTIIEIELNLILQVYELENGKSCAHLVLHTPLKDFTVDQCVLIKHLFYKKSIRVNIDGQNISVYNWIKEYLYKLCSVISPKDKETLPKEYFSYSLVEINRFDLAKKGEEISPDILYALLTSDEGWRFLPEKFASDRLQCSWSSRRYLQCYLLGGNGLLINNRNSRDYKEYIKFQTEHFKNYSQNGSNKYIDFIKCQPCLAGVDSLIFMNFQKGAEKKEDIRSAIQTIETFESKQPNERALIADLEQLLLEIQCTLNSKAFSVHEMESLNGNITQSFGIDKDFKSLKDSFSRKMQELSSAYENKTNSRVFLLTWMTILIGLIQISFVIVYRSEVIVYKLANIPEKANESIEPFNLIAPDIYVIALFFLGHLAWLFYTKRTFFIQKYRAIRDLDYRKIHTRINEKNK